LQKAVGVSNKAGIVCLSPSKLQSLEGIPIKVSGWGQTSDSKGSTSPVLLATELIGSNMVIKSMLTIQNLKKTLSGRDISDSFLNEL